MKLHVIDRHLLVELEPEGPGSGTGTGTGTGPEGRGGLALVDTGAPFAIGRGRAARVLGEEWCPSSEHAAALDAGEAHLGVALEWLIGWPTLSRGRLWLDWSSGRAQLSASALALPGATRVPLGFEAKVPRVDAVVGGRAVRVVLDTGAPLSYVPPAAVARLTPVRQERDFHPSIGSFDTGVWRLPASVAGRAFEIEAGLLPPALAPLVTVSGGWILGSDFFKARSVVIDYPGAQLFDAPGGTTAT